MSSCTKKRHNKNTCVLKNQLQTILQNVRALESLEEPAPEQLISATSALLGTVEQQTRRRHIVQTVKKRKRNRRRKKQTAKQNVACKKVSNTISKKIQQQKEVEVEPKAAQQHQEQPQQTEQPTNEFHQSRCFGDAQGYLRKFELLKMLHFARCRDHTSTQQFHEQFTQLRSVWNNILQENIPKRTAAGRIEDQWQETLFGASEQSYYNIGKKNERERLREFLRIRRIWDSYVVRNRKHASCIPTGWVLPTTEPSAQWAQYRQ